MLEKRMQRNELFQILNQYFNIDELKMIFCLLELDYSPIKWQPKNEVTDLLLDEVLKSDTQHTLIKIVEEQRPFLFNLPRNKDKSASLPALDSKTNFMMLNRGGLLKLLNSDFSISQLYQLANELDVDETSFPAQQTKIGFILDLILFLETIGKLDKLRIRLSRHYLDQDYILPKQITFKTVDDRLKKTRRMEMPNTVDFLPPLHERIAFYLSTEEVKTLCVGLGIDWEDLSGANLGDKAKSLVVFCEKMNQLNDLFAVLEQNFPTVAWARSQDI